jgi:acetyl-CoA C-acetyltransferase
VAIPSSTPTRPRRIKVDKIPSLKPAFAKDGTITAASSSSINDGASALVMMRVHREIARVAANRPNARPYLHAQAPGWFTTAPVEAIAKLYRKLDWNTGSVDLFEINEAFAVVPMAAMHDLDIPRDKVNIHGGACALGHRSALPARVS